MNPALRVSCACYTGAAFLWRENSNMKNIKYYERIVIKEVGNTLEIDSKGRVWKLRRMGILTLKQVEKLRNLYSTKQYMLEHLARMFNISGPHAHHIVNNQRLVVKRKRAETKNASGYLAVVIHKNKKTFSTSAHRLVWQYFYGDIPKGLEINHKNGRKTDNRPENLEVVTAKQNVQHSLKLGLQKVLKGEEIGTSKLTEKQVREMRKLYSTGNYKMKELAKRFSISYYTIWDVVRRKSWRHIK